MVRERSPVQSRTLAHTPSNGRGALARPGRLFAILTTMELIELTAENIDHYVDDCVHLQAYLVKPGTVIDPAQMRATASATHTYFIGLQEAGHLVGLGVVNQIVHPVRTDAYVDNIVVHPDFRGRGLFTVLMDALEAKGKAWGAGQVRLTCSRAQVQPLYEKRQYTEKPTKYYIKDIR